MGIHHLGMTRGKAFPRERLTDPIPVLQHNCSSVSGPAASQLLYINQKQFIATLIAELLLTAILLVH